MCKRAFAGTVFLCAMLVVVGFADGAVPRLIDFQGRLTDADADPVSGTKSMVFEFRNLPAGGILLGAFSETQSVTVTDGIFNATIGSETPGGIPSAIFDSVIVYLSVKVAGEELLPRRRVVAAAYALRAEKADEADHATSADSADTALTADYATAAGVAQSALSANHATSADSADTALIADYATAAGAAQSALSANHATSADSAGTASNADYATTAGAAQSAQNADLLDMLDSTAFAAADHTHPGGDMTPAEILTALKTVDGPGSGLDADMLDNRNYTVFAAFDHTHAVNAEETLTALLTVDGSGSGLNADLLDKLDGSFYRDATNLNAGTLSNARFSAYSDLSAEGYLDNSSSLDLLTQAQSDGHYVNVTGDTMTGALDITGSLHAATGGVGAIRSGVVEQSVLNGDIAAGNNLRADKSLYLGSSAGSGNIYVKNTSGTTMFQVSGASGDVTAGGSVSAADNVTAGGDVAVGGDLTVDWDATIDRVLYVTPEDGIGGIICGNVAQSTFNLDIATEGSLKADDALYVGSSSHSGDVYVKNTSGTTTFQVTGSSGDITTTGDLNTAAGNGIDLATNSGGVWSLYGSNVAGSSQLRLTGPSYGEFLLDWANAAITLGGSNADSVSIPAEVQADSGIVVFENSSGSANAAAVRAENTNAAGIAFTGRVTSSDACTVLINKGTGEIIKGFSGATGGNLVFQVQNSGRVVCSALQITGGGDLAEPFDFANADAVKPGMVVAIDPHNPGKLRLAVKAYDKTVAGVISGANGVKPGVTMQQEGTAASGTLPVALTGRVYCWCDAANGAIEPGDLLTTSDTPGHAMKVTDYDRSRGATIGKAMTSLKEGRGFVLMLVMPQ